MPGTRRAGTTRDAPSLYPSRFVVASSRLYLDPFLIRSGAVDTRVRRPAINPLESSTVNLLFSYIADNLRTE